MNSGEFDEKVNNRLIKFPAVDGLTDLEQRSLVAQVGARMKKVQERMDIVDTSKVAIVAAYELAAELYIMHQKAEDTSDAVSRSMDQMISRLESALSRK